MKVRRLGGMFALVLLSFSEAAAKPRHFEQLRVLLISRAAKCTSCHDSPESKGLNEYGRRLAELPQDETMADRIAKLESDPPANASQQNRDIAARDHDVDQDGVMNWVEILAGTSPADARDHPKKAMVTRITTVISCAICHTATNQPGEGLAANPHNALGDLLARTLSPGQRQSKGDSEDAIRAAAERIPILVRLSLVAAKKAPKAKATYWQAIRMLYIPTEPERGPDVEELKGFKKKLARQKRTSTRDPNLGLNAKAHPLDGFLLDAKGLE